MKIIGLTGGIGMGKSATDQLLRQRSIAVIDTDILAREVVEPGQPALVEIQQAFGRDVIGSDGQLLRGELARRVFADALARKKLEAILHPRIRALWRGMAEHLRAQGAPLAVIVIPLLFETNAQAELDATICVACSPATQRERLLSRGWSEDEIAHRIASQWPIEKKMVLSDYVVWTEGGLDLLDPQLGKIPGLSFHAV